MELHSKISYYITNTMFKDFYYVEQLHDKIPSKFDSYHEFKSVFKQHFDHDYFWDD